MKIFKIPRKAHTYLANKLRGGAANEKGNKYEGFFAVFKISELFNLHKNMPQLGTISGQHDAFIDDLMIENNGQRSYFQLKSSLSISWGAGLGSLFMDFVYQKVTEKYHNRKFRLYLVVAAEKIKDRLNKKKPYGIKRCSEAFFFPYHDSMLGQIKGDAKFKSELGKLSYPGATEDKLEALGAHILGQWGATNKTAVSIADLYDKIAGLNLAFFASKDDNHLAEKTVIVLNSISGFTFNVSGGYFNWKYGKSDSGVIPYKIGTAEMNSIEDKIQNLKPVDFSNLEPLLS